MPAFRFHSWSPTWRLTSRWPRLFWCSGVQAENWAFAKVVSGTTTYFRKQLRSYFGLDPNSLTWRPNHQPTDRPSVQIPSNGPILKRAKNLHSCDVYALHHSTVRNGNPACSTSVTAAQTKPGKLSEVSKSQRSHFRPMSLVIIPLTGGWVVFLGSCYVLFYSTLLLPCCFASRHTTLLLFVWQLTQVGLGGRWCKKDSQKNTQKSRKSRSPYFMFSFEAWPSEEKYIFTQIHAVCFCIGCVISDIGPSLLFRPIL